MEAILNHARREAERAMSNRATTRIGIVDSYDPNTYTARVRYQPENILSGWLPVLTPWVGDQWGLFAPPTPGDQVLVEFQEAGLGVGNVCLRAYSDVDRPLKVDSGEWWLVHKTGSFVKLTNDGKVLINGQVEIDVTSPKVETTATMSVDTSAPKITSTASVENDITGPQINITASTAISITAPSIHTNSSGANLHQLVTDALVALFNGHTHPDPQGGTTGVPNQQMGQGHLTGTLRAS